MASNNIYFALLRPPVLQILRAAGFHATRPAALDTLVDLALRYICLLASQSAAHASISHNEMIPTIADVRMALQDVGALRPQLGMMEEQCNGEEDTRGVDAFLRWMTGDDTKEIRRVAGMLKVEGDADVDAGAEREDFLTMLKKKQSKTGEESRFQGTVLGKGADPRPVRVEGAPFESIESWETSRRQQHRVTKVQSTREPSSVTLSSASSPLSEIQNPP